MINQIHNVDCLEGINKLEDNSIDLQICSPPYNVDLGNNKYKKSGYDIYNDNKDYNEYLLWLKEIFKNLYKKMKVGSRVVINVGDLKNGAIPLSSDVIQFMKEIGYISMSHIIWNKNQCGNRLSFGSWLSPSSPSFPTPFEHILIFCKETKKMQHKGETDLTKQEFIDWSLALWNFPGETKAKSLEHPAPFPIELPKRLIKMLTYKDDIVLDIFGGIGTTALASKILNRKYIIFEISKNYCVIAENRLKEYHIL